MKLSFEITYNAEKLQKEMPNIIKQTVKNLSNSFIEGSKKTIESGRGLQKLKQSTINIRRTVKPKTNSTKPLQHTGKLLKSLSQYANGDMGVQKYGLYHLPDDIFDLSEESIVTQVSATKRAKSGIAYTTSPNSRIPNKDVPIRNWFQMDKGLAKKAISKFHKLIKKNFKRSMSLSFSRIKG
tara:strand:- start:2458 stop:3003 length:546 start_codon:yes stop_codon:yes gene_type:complete